jgi:hypothetical protein
MGICLRVVSCDCFQRTHNNLICALVWLTDGWSEDYNRQLVNLLCYQTFSQGLCVGICIWEVTEYSETEN